MGEGTPALPSRAHRHRKAVGRSFHWTGGWAAAAMAATMLWGTHGTPPSSTGDPLAEEFLGREVCANCHEDRAEQHADSNFAGSWRPTSMLDQMEFERTAREGGIRYQVNKGEHGWRFEVRLPGRPTQSFPIHSLIGGQRFGHSMLLEVSAIESRPLPRSTLVEARYFIEAGSGRLKISPGFPREVPRNYETAVGRPLSPSFSEKCLDCHGGIRDRELASRGAPHPRFVDTGVGCERCHGSGSRHLEALDSEGGDLAILNPAKLRHPQVMELCGTCHSGFSPVSRPRPKDLLISNQVNALSRSLCYVRSGGAFSCVSCHDPHRNASHDDPVYNQTCNQCHGGSKPTVPTCRSQPRGDCVACHMPVVDRPGNFELRDHWIRVLPASTLSPAESEEAG